MPQYGRRQCFKKTLNNFLTALSAIYRTGEISEIEFELFISTFELFATTLTDLITLMSVPHLIHMFFADI